jgi:hypothetical protein
MRARSSESIGEYWVSERGLCWGQGYVVGDRSRDDFFLEEYLQLDARYSEHPHTVLTDGLLPYRPKGLQWPRNPRIYQAPLVLVRKGFKSDRKLGRALYSATKLAYCESYYGFSAAGHPNGESLAQYLLVLIYSNLFEYWTLMTSGEFGVERDALQLNDIKSFPFVTPDTLDQVTRGKIQKCAKSLLARQPDWRALDNTIASIYGLGHYDQEVITDVLATRAPFPEVKAHAAKPCATAQLEEFRIRLQDELSNVLSTSGHSVHVTQLPDIGRLPWKFVAISLNRQALPETPPSTWVEQAEDFAVSRITIVDAHLPRIVVGLLDRYRYWTQTQARLLASDILWQYGALLEERAGR